MQNTAVDCISMTCHEMFFLVTKSRTVFSFLWHQGQKKKYCALLQHSINVTLMGENRKKKHFSQLARAWKCLQSGGQWFPVSDKCSPKTTKTEASCHVRSPVSKSYTDMMDWFILNAREREKRMIKICGRNYCWEVSFLTVKEERANS